MVEDPKVEELAQEMVETILATTEDDQDTHRANVYRLTKELPRPKRQRAIRLGQVDESARQWELAMAGRFGDAVARRRRHLGLSAIQLWERTVKLGYPVTRIAISKIENNTRSGKLDMAEVLILACALEIPPVLLLYPDYPRGVVEFLPGRDIESERAARWISGVEPPSENAVPGAGVELVQVAYQRSQLARGSIRAFFDERGDEGEAAQRVLSALHQDLARCNARIEELSTQLWGASGG